MTHSTIDLGRIAATDSGRAARLLQGVYAAALSGQRPSVGPRPVIGQSWERMLSRGVDPDHDHRNRLLTREDIERRRHDSPLHGVLPVLRESLLSIADAARHIMVVADADGRVLWREGSAAVLRRADVHGFELGADWSESTVGTNGIGTALVVRGPVQVFSAEHFVRTHHDWTCTGAPLTDPRDGRLIGVLNLSGPLESLHPATLALVSTAAKLAEAELRTRHLADLDRLRTVAAPLLARVGGRALAVDPSGWTAAVTGMPPVDRLPLPKAFGPGRAWLPSLGACAVEPLPGGWLVRPDGEPTGQGPATRVVLDLSSPRHYAVTVSGYAGDWTHELSPRHAELLYLLAAHPAGSTAAQLADAVFADPGRRVTVRAELSRIRRYLAGLLDHRPYRFRENATVEMRWPEQRTDLLPHSTAPAVTRARLG
ncbi:GAF domain-containing protein [Streptomyces apocyni]|uniref:GAF domain-containing protein n=1 Tax=Streptomyces apocyni TaxID=2654677 RepID=UPI0012E9EB37|nr:helix-turn-helix domain-containing protein [Streptomyces apocyni]